MWLRDYLPEVESDLSVFHRIDRMDEMDGSRWCLLAPRLAAYGGALASALRRDHPEAVRNPAPPSARPAASPQATVAPMAEPSPEWAASQPPEIRELFSFGTA